MEIKDDFIGTKFGPFLQLTVIGWNGERNSGGKKYSVQCSVCKEDSTLYGDGIFLITANKIKIGRIPCGCSRNTRWTKEQWKIKIKRECELRDYKFIGFFGKYSGRGSKIILETPFGQIDVVLLSNFIKGQDTYSVWKLKVGESNTKDSEYHIKNFMATGAYPLGTSFERDAEKTDCNGWKTYWRVSCPVCTENYSSHLSNLSAGCVGCSCSQRRHNKSYIHVVSDVNGIMGIKFGITSVLTSRRLKEQVRKSGLLIEEFGIWDYDEVSACRKAEVEVKKVYNNYLSKDVLPDGYTETASFSDIESIVAIFESNGGIRRSD